MAFANHIETNSTSESIYEGKICAWFLNFLKNLKTQEFELLHNNINEFFGEDIMDINFVNWFAKKNKPVFSTWCVHAHTSTCTIWDKRTKKMKEQKHKFNSWSFLFKTFC